MLKSSEVLLHGVTQKLKSLKNPLKNFNLMKVEWRCRENAQSTLRCVDVFRRIEINENEELTSKRKACAATSMVSSNEMKAESSSCLGQRRAHLYTHALSEC